MISLTVQFFEIKPATLSQQLRSYLRAIFIHRTCKHVLIESTVHSKAICCYNHIISPTQCSNRILVIICRNNIRYVSFPFYRGIIRQYLWLQKQYTSSNAVKPIHPERGGEIYFYTTNKTSSLREKYIFLSSTADA